MLPSMSKVLSMSFKAKYLIFLCLICINIQMTEHCPQRQSYLATLSDNNGAAILSSHFLVFMGCQDVYISVYR